jgi:hypothetical protein
MEDSRKCACDMCNCQATEGTNYCSDHCRDVAEQDITEIRCDCGHSGCA